MNITRDAQQAQLPGYGTQQHCKNKQVETEVLIIINYTSDLYTCVSTDFPAAIEIMI